MLQLLKEKSDMSISDIGEFLETIGDICTKDIDILKAQYFNLEYTDLSNFSKIENLNYDSLKEINAIPFEISSNTAHIAISDPKDIYSSNVLNSCLASCELTKNLNKKYYIANKHDIQYNLQETKKSSNNIIDNVILQSIKANASDIHITPYEKTIEIMARIDGDLQKIQTACIQEFQSISISLKVLAKMDIAETRRAQSGRFQKYNVDFRISTHPTTHGENIVIRILNKNKSFLSIKNIGFSEEHVEFLTKITSFANGMIIFCGPTGSGKTTSIYSLLETMDKKARNIMTLEDPVEYKIQNIKQTEIKNGVINFTEGIRSILRQDPDVIVIGEIRDEETAKMAIRASMTGHLVLTTIHANNSVSALMRFKELGISQSLIADNIIAIVSQRLVKTTCGRTIVSEILNIDDEINNMIYTNVSKQKITAYAKDNMNFKTLHDDCLAKHNSGVISKSEMQNILRLF